MKRTFISSGSPYEDLVGFSRAVRIGPYISIGGTAAIDAGGNTVGIGDIAAQTRQCMEIIRLVLEKAGSGLEYVVRTRVLLTHIEDWEEVARVKASYFKGHKPVTTMMQVARFIQPEWLIEMEADAIVSR